jgi:peptide/nickel transport system substrate-binding protein
LLLVAATAPASAAPEGQMTWATEMDPRVRQHILANMRQLFHERGMFGPVIEPAFMNGVGPRVDQPGLGMIASHAYSAPYEDVTLTKR